MSVYLRANQVAAGLALTIFGIGLSAFIGLPYEGKILSLPPARLFGLDALFYFSFVMLAATAWFLTRTRAGLILRAVGENHHAAHALGYPVNRIRFFACLYGGAMCGVAGAYLSVIYTPLWAQNMTAGRGWIVLALVVFAAWRPLRLWAGAYLFGFIGIAQLFWQAGGGAPVPAQFLNMAPYLATIAALLVISAYHRAGVAPRCLTRPLPPQ